jgi:hypothetical protein
VQSVADSWTHCVALDDPRPGNERDNTFRELVTDERCYVHRYGGGGLPTERPNFFAIRWAGAV